MEPLILPKGFGFQALSAADLRAQSSLLDIFQVWERPRTRGPRKYVLGVDVSDGIGEDRSVIEVVRMGTIEEPAEQVAEYVSDSIIPMALAHVVYAIGMYYKDADGVEAKAAIEINNHGLSTQDTLQGHLGYGNFYVWEYLNAADPSRRYSTALGWRTSNASRPALLDKLYAALTTVDPFTNLPDLITHSSILHDELKDFETDTVLWEAQAGKGAHDDTLMALGIANYVAWKLQAGETEPLEERRRRRAEQTARNEAAAAPGPKPDWRNTPCDAHEMAAWEGHSDAGDRETELDELLYDPLGSAMRR